MQEKNYPEGKYTGYMVNGIREIEGTMEYKNGDIYKGQWKTGEKEGKGNYKYKETKEEYDGEWKNGKKEGLGILIKANGDRYIGEWKNDLYHGKGTYYYNSGNSYEGSFQFGKKNGKGVTYYSNGYCEVGDYINGDRKGIHARLSKEGKVSPGDYTKKVNQKRLFITMGNTTLNLRAIMGYFVRIELILVVNY